MLRLIGDMTRTIADYTVGTVIVMTFFLTADRNYNQDAAPSPEA